MIDSSEFITCDFYENFVKELKRDDIVFIPTEEIADFFAKTPDDAKLTIVSAMSDYSIRYQAPNHPNKDIIKHASAMNWPHIANITDKYAAIQIGPTCNTEKCNVDDLYSVKIDRHTIATFSRIPKGIRWYCTNLDIQHSQATWLPFGINYHGHGKDILANYQGRPKRGLVYLNYQNNSYDRAHIKNHFRRQPWVTFRENVPVEQFFEEMAEHQFVISPFGNGLDCFRNYEAFYLGTVPIIEDSFLTNYMQAAGLPVFACNDFTALNGMALRSFSYSPTDFDREVLAKRFWRDKIRG